MQRMSRWFALLPLLVLSSCDFPILSSLSSSETSLTVSSDNSVILSSSNNESVSSEETLSSETLATLQSLTISRDTWPSLGAYPSEETEVSFSGFSFGYFGAGNYTAGVIQGRRNEFYLYNKDPIDRLAAITLTFSQSHSEHVLFVGNEAFPQETTLDPVEVDTTIQRYDVPSPYAFPYFHLDNQGGAMYLNTIQIDYYTEGSVPTSSASSEVSSLTSSESPSTTSISSTSTTTSTTPSSSTPSSSTSNLTVVTNAPTYYQSISPSLTGEALKNALDTLISSNISVSYDWSRFEYADQHPTNTNQVLTIYPKLGYLKTAHVNGNAADHWNREHTYPQSKIGGDALNDNHHIFADDWKTNGTRGNNKFGDVANTEANRVLDSANRPTNNFTAGGYFEPNDEAKGEVARATLYMNTLYGYTLENNFQTAEMAVLWALDYPVNDWAMTRNNRVYDKQKNRNPYIDHPEWICAVYGTTSTATRQACGL
jgi:endonuclease I